MKKPFYSRIQSEYPLWLRLAASAIIGLLLCGVIQNLSTRYKELPVTSGRIPPSLVAYCLFALAGLLFFVIQIWASNWFLPLNRMRARLGWTRWMGVAIAGLLPGLFFANSDWSTVFSGTWVRIWVELIFLGGMAWLAASGEEKSWDLNGLVISLLIIGSLTEICGYFNNITDYPFSLKPSWSEGNRLWDYSVLFGRHIYIFPPDKPIPAYIDIGRQSLWGLPFLFGNPSILQMRIWDNMVWIVPNLLLGWALIRPLKGQRTAWFLFGLWALIFLIQGPIYSPLVLAAALVALVRRKPVWLAVIALAAAGIYARYTRYTWLVAPAMWAGMMWILQASKQEGISLWKRWLPAISVAFGGVLGGFILPEILNLIWRRLYGAPFQIGGANVMEISVSSLSQNVTRQPLLFDRLWPGQTNSLGIVLSLVLAVGPLVILLVALAWKGGWQLTWWQKTAILAPMTAFLAVGLVVSVKIGGGNNLHDMDMFLVGLLFLSAVAWEFITEKWGFQIGGYPWWIKTLLVMMLIIPFTQTLTSLNAVTFPDPVKWKDALGGTRDAAVASAKKGEVLFMDQRQLLTFGEVKGVPLVADYEKKYLMDMAMANSADYFNQFVKDLAAHRFTLIVSEELHVNANPQGSAHTFGNENDAWVQWVSIPVLCYYQPEAIYPGITELLKPRDKPESPAPNVTCPTPAP